MPFEPYKLPRRFRAQHRFSISSAATLAIFVMTLFVTHALATSKETVLYNFSHGRDGSRSSSNLIFDAAGNLYGTAYEGGAGKCNDGLGTVIGCGVVFELTPKTGVGWTEKVLYSFLGGKDGQWPAAAGVVFDAHGNLFGTTAYGGTGSCHDNTGPGCGVVFELSPKTGGGWTEKVLHSFNGKDGRVPEASLLLDDAGNLYGTTFEGGTGLCKFDSPKITGCGVVFELAKATEGWTEKVLYSFVKATNGRFPQANLIFDASGNLYGTTTEGGTENCCGTVFELKAQSGGGWVETVLHRFNGTDGQGPYAGLIFDSSGNLYGTTNRGGGTHIFGTVFKLTPNANEGWTETILHRFSGTGTDGFEVFSALIFDTAGNLYGTTSSGGAFYNKRGTVFELTPHTGGRWTETVLFSFNTKDGDAPYAGLVLDGAGNLYGTTLLGGTGECPYGEHGVAGCGVVFEITP
jgi:uncharacterized repeat protein (TIGR03803 family)